MPGYLVIILAYWPMMVCWGDATSTPFHVRNGVRQGGILSPYLFNVYMDELSCRLNACRAGCLSGNMILNHLMYADDLARICPYTGGMYSMLKIFCVK